MTFTILLFSTLLVNKRALVRKIYLLMFWQAKATTFHRFEYISAYFLALAVQLKSDFIAFLTTISQFFLS